MCILLLSVKRPRSLWNFLMFNTHTQDNRAAISLSTTSRCVCLSIPFGCLGKRWRSPEMTRKEEKHHKWNRARRRTTTRTQNRMQSCRTRDTLEPCLKVSMKNGKLYSVSFFLKKGERKKVSGWLLRSNAGAPFFSYMSHFGITLVRFLLGGGNSGRILRWWKCVDDLLLHFQCVWWRPR